jgi:hypothetical protein
VWGGDELLVVVVGLKLAAAGSSASSSLPGRRRALSHTLIGRSPAASSRQPRTYRALTCPKVGLARRLSPTTCASSAVASTVSALAVRLRRYQIKSSDVRSSLSCVGLHAPERQAPHRLSDSSRGLRRGH